MLNRSKMMIAALGVTAIAGASWMVGDLTARADDLPLAGAPLVCTKGFAATGNQDGYTCRSEVFKCKAGLSILSKSIYNNRAVYVCGKPVG